MPDTMEPHDDKQVTDSRQIQLRSARLELAHLNRRQEQLVEQLRRLTKAPSRPIAVPGRGCPYRWTVFVF